MLFTIAGKHIEITEAVRRYAEKKTAKLPKYYSSINHIEVIVDGERSDKPSVEIIARGEHRKIFIVTETAADIHACIDMAVHKLERQLRRKKGKERDNKHTRGQS